MISQSAQLIRKLACIVAIASLAAGCGSAPETRPATAKRVSVGAGTADQAVSIALQQVGAPYRYGGSSPAGFDCSGLVHYSYSKAGKSVPRTTSTLWSSIRPVATNQLQKGDVLFFRISGKMSHVGMYIGGGRFVHAPSSGKVVAVASLGSDFYSDAFIRAGRP